MSSFETLCTCTCICVHALFEGFHCIQVISPKALLAPTGLGGMYTDILDLFPKHCSLLVELTHPRLPGGKLPRVPGFHFLTNAMWPSVASLIEERVPAIFAPGNPDIFHKVHCIAIHVYTYTSFTLSWHI